MQLADLNAVDMHYKKDNFTSFRSKNPFRSTFHIPLKLTKVDFSKNEVTRKDDEYYKSL